MFHLFVATAEKVVFDNTVISVIVPGSVGYFEVLQNHAPIISSLIVGTMVITDKKFIKSHWAISGGLIEVNKNNATVLADAVELASEIDLKRAQASLLKAQVLLDSKDPSIDIPRAKRALERAKNRIKISESFSNKYKPLSAKLS